MTPTSSEKQAALACPCNCSDASCNCKKVLVAALRASEAEAEMSNSYLGLLQSERDSARSRLKTLEEENARMREKWDELGDKVDALRDFQCCDLSSKFCGCKESFDELASTFDAALKQEAE